MRQSTDDMADVEQECIGGLRKRVCIALTRGDHQGSQDDQSIDIDDDCSQGDENWAMDGRCCPDRLGERQATAAGSTTPTPLGLPIVGAMNATIDTDGPVLSSDESFPHGYGDRLHEVLASSSDESLLEECAGHLQAGRQMTASDALRGRAGLMDKARTAVPTHPVSKDIFLCRSILPFDVEPPDSDNDVRNCVSPARSVSDS